MESIQIGSRVEIINEHEMATVMSTDPRPPLTFRLKRDSGTYGWYLPSDIRLVTSSLTSGKPVTSFEVGKWYQWVGPKDFRNNWAPEMEAWKDGKPRKCIGVGRGGTRGNFEGIGEYFYGHCFEHFREVPAPTQGHRHIAMTSFSVVRDDVCGEPRIGKHTVSTYPYRIQGVDVRTRTVTFKTDRPVSTRAAIRRRLLNLE